jgi:hypothetical protein
VISPSDLLPAAGASHELAISITESGSGVLILVSCTANIPDWNRLSSLRGELKVMIGLKIGENVKIAGRNSRP